MKPSLIQNLVLGTIAFVLTLVAYWAVESHWGYRGTSAKSDGPIVEQPRTDTPMGSSTFLFARRQFVIADAKRKRILTYYWSDAENPPPGAKLPLVVVLHGSTGNAYAAQFLVSREVRRAFPAYILVPQSPSNKHWAVPDQITGQQRAAFDATYLTRRPEAESLPDAVEIIRRSVKQYPIDEKRIYVVGCSEGGMGAFAAVLRYPDLFAGAIAISGSWSVLDAPRMTHVPLLIMHGSQDDVLPVQFTRALAASIKQNGGNVTYWEFGDVGHNCPLPQFYSERVWQWLFGQSKDAKRP